MKKVRMLLIVLILIFIIACAGTHNYTPPAMTTPMSNVIILNKSKDSLWKKIIPSIGKSFFIINNLDKASGIINVSYSGDPEKYIDCGRINSYVKNARGERTYDFPASRANQTYEIMDMEHGAILLFVDRKMNLEGRINIIIEELSSKDTQITINTKYILTKSTTTRNVQGASRQLSDTISIISGQQGIFPGSGDHSGTICHPNGTLEQEILTILTSSVK